VAGTDRDARDEALRLAPDVVFERVEGSALLINLATNRMFELDPAGTRFWELLSDGNDREAAEAALLDEYDVQPEVLREDITSLVERLVSEGLVVRGGTA
jgi:coenzyme PQQ synthesis protein D (PqqD)